MDLAGCKPYVGNTVVVNTNFGKQFVGTLVLIEGSSSTIKLTTLPDQIAAQYSFAINGVDALDVSTITFLQTLGSTH